MNVIEETTEQLFCINYEVDFENEDVYYHYLEKAEKLINDNSWQSVYSCWYLYLINRCKDEEAALNFANLFWCYQGQKNYIPNSIEFCAYFYAIISFDRHPEADYLIDGMTCEILLNSGVYTQKELYDYIPLNDPKILDAIKDWHERGILRKK